MKLILILVLSACIAATSLADQDPGRSPNQESDGTVAVIVEHIRRSLKDPDSLIVEKWSDVKLGKSPGGKPAWLVSVTYRAKNSYGAYTGTTRENFWFTESGEPRLDSRKFPR